MIAQASGLGMGVGRISRLLRGLGVIAMPNAELNTTRRIEDPPGPGVLQLLVTGVAVGELIDCRCVADRVEVTR
jgi:hypothetical protein